jgi:hypothetical protein
MNLEQTIDAIATAVPSRERRERKVTRVAKQPETIDRGGLGWFFVIPITLVVMVAICLWLVTLAH